MNFGGRTSPEDGVRIIHAALDEGINFIDTANVYNAGRSEETVGEALAGRRDDVVVATKVFGHVGSGPNDQGASRFSVFREVDRSLVRLRTDWIDLYQLHRFDTRVLLEETLSALDDLVRMGKVRYVGVSNFPAWRIAQAQGIGERLNLAPISSLQPPYNVLERDVERELIPACTALGIGVIPWSPLAGGLLADRFVGGNIPADARAATRMQGRPLWEPLAQAIDKLAALAAQSGTTLSRFALAWVRDAPGVTSPIIGPSRQEQLSDAIASLDVKLDADARAAVDEIVEPGSSLWFRAGIMASRQRIPPPSPSTPVRRPAPRSKSSPKKPPTRRPPKGR
jgi:aryl-alcohol dehydrogenase-like predicted oxidoreductase